MIYINQLIEQPNRIYYVLKTTRGRVCVCVGLPNIYVPTFNIQMLRYRQHTVRCVTYDAKLNTQQLLTYTLP